MDTLIGKTLEQANFLLARGYATKQNAIDFIIRWNEGGKRLTKVDLGERLSFACGVSLKTPFIFQK
jgi:hypothetical protein